MEREIQCLRDSGYSFATHLLESGTDVRYIQELLGHKSSRTTEVYTDVTCQSLAKIRSSLDRLMGESMNMPRYSLYPLEGINEMRSIDASQPNIRKQPVK